MLIKNLYDLDKTIAKPLLEKLDYPWEALPKIKDFIIELGKTLDPEIYGVPVSFILLRELPLQRRVLLPRSRRHSPRLRPLPSLHHHRPE